jgi:hypothetical protein
VAQAIAWRGALCFPPKTFPGHMNTTKSPSGDEFKLLIQERIKNFWGYGNLSGDVWFVGMEEGYNEDNEILLERFKATANAEVFDIYDDLKVDPGHVYWFEDGAPTQSTYRQLIYLLLYLQNKMEPTLEDIRDFQIKKFGRKISNHAALELMPLPAKSIRVKDWLYASTAVKGLASRKEYLAEYKPMRVQRLRELVGIHKPKVVIFYSRTYLPDWQEVVPVLLEEIVPKKLHIAKDHSTLYAVVPHSTAFGISKGDWKQIAEAILNYP